MLEARGHCGGSLAGYPGAQRDAVGWYVEASETCGRAGSFGDGDLRLYSCPVALAGDVAVSGLPALYAASQGGLPAATLGHAAVSEGAAAGVNVLAMAWAWRRSVEHEVEMARRKQAHGRPAR